MSYQIEVVRSNPDEASMGDPPYLSILLNHSEVTRIPEQETWTTADVAHQVWVGVQATIDRIQADQSRPISGPTGIGEPT